MVICVVGFGTQTEFQAISDMLTTGDIVVVGGLIDTEVLFKDALSELENKLIECVDTCDELFVVNYEYDEFNSICINKAIEYAKKAGKDITVRKEFKYDNRINNCKLSTDSEDKPRVVCLCGSTKYKESFMSVARDLTLQGDIVLMPLVFSHADNEKLSYDEIQLLKKVHLSKIDMCDVVYVLDIDNYIGEGTVEETEYAKSKGKNIIYHSTICKFGQPETRNIGIPSFINYSNAGLKWARGILTNSERTDK